MQRVGLSLAAAGVPDILQTRVRASHSRRRFESERLELLRAAMPAFGPRLPNGRKQVVEYITVTVENVPSGLMQARWNLRGAVLKSPVAGQKYCPAIAVNASSSGLRDKVCS